MHGYFYFWLLAVALNGCWLCDGFLLLLYVRVCWAAPGSRAPAQRARPPSAVPPTRPGLEEPCVFKALLCWWPPPPPVASSQ
jgi:hypothetical protein